MGVVDDVEVDETPVRPTFKFAASGSGEVTPPAAVLPPVQPESPVLVSE